MAVLGLTDARVRALKPRRNRYDVRWHDRRHSHAVMKGVPLPAVSKPLGHARPAVTLRYAHVADRGIEQAAERVGAALARRGRPWGGQGVGCPHVARRCSPGP